MAKTACSAVLGALLIAGLAHAQQAAPVDSKGVTNKALASLELGPEIEGMAGRHMRLRMVTLAPGGTIAAHNHKDRPSIEYILQGTVTEYRNGIAKEYGPNEFITADKGTTHGWENKGTVQVILLPFDLFKP
ncbi:MAG: cupin domain-containing protein [Pseudomonadota bacterium]